MAINRLETQSVLNFLNSLHPPVHVILLYEEASELDDIESKITVEASREATQHAMDQAYAVTLTRKEDIKRCEFHRVEPEDLSNLERLIEYEEKIRESHQPKMVLCAYPLKQVIELDTTIFVDVLSQYDYVLFTRFEEGRKMMLEAVEEALESSLGRSGSEMIYRFAQQMGIKREQIPSNLRRFRRILRELLGIGADYLERLIFKALYLGLKSHPRAVSVNE